MSTGQATATPQAVKGNSVTPMPKITDGQVQDAAEALGKSGQAFPDAVDGRNPDRNPESTEIDDDADVRVPVPKPNPQINKKTADAITKIESLAAQRKELNSQISAVIEDLEAAGINRHAFRYAMKVSQMAEKQRDGLDLSYILTRQAAGLPLQSDWVHSDDEKH